jgi:hypothetical protein
MEDDLGGRAYVRPTVRDYGDLVQLTGDVTMLHVGLGGATTAQVSGAAAPGGGLAGITQAGDGTDAGTAGSGTAPANGVGGTLGTSGSGGSSNGGGGGGGGGGGNLPFTGLALGVIAAAGGGLSAAGAALRRRFRR